MTPKQALLAHLTERHPHLYFPKSSTLDNLQNVHKRAHHRYSVDHDHAGSNTGAGDRPAGWKTGGDVVMRAERKMAPR